MQDQARCVRRYYNKNTFWMLLFGQGRGEGVIHRAVWTGEESSRTEALHTVERMIAETLLEAAGKSPARSRLLDLGCGVGGSALWLAARHPFSITGISLSPTQVRRARKLAKHRGLSNRCRFLAADFTQLPQIPGVTAAYAIESFSHGEDPATFFTQVGNVLPAGGRLILCDDFVAAKTRTVSNRREAWLSQLRDGWHLKSLMTCSEALRTAEQHSFQLVKKTDLTPYLRQTPLLIRRLQHLAGSMLPGSAWGASMMGGSALQICQKNGWTEYLFLVLEKL
jgi:tocopherol O-methyltransferase